MVEKIKIGFWELFTYFSLGFILLMEIIVYQSLLNDDFKAMLLSLLEDNSVVVIGLFPIICFLLGMIFEPFANLFVKKIEKISFLKPRKSRGILGMNAVLSNYIPSFIDEKQYFRYCKAMVEQVCPGSNVSTFLSRYGFYRGLSVIFLLSIIFLFFIDVSLCFIIINSFILVVSSYISIRRAQVFLGHMEYEVYFNFIVFSENKKVES